MYDLTQAYMFPSWRWVLLFLVLAGLVTAVILLASDEQKWEHVVVGVIAVAAGVGILAHYYALLPLRAMRICYADPNATATEHHLAYITKAEMAILRLPKNQGGHNATGDAIPGVSGTQGVPCFAKKEELCYATLVQDAQEQGTLFRGKFPIGTLLHPDYDEEGGDQEAYVWDVHGRDGYPGAEYLVRTKDEIINDPLTDKNLYEKHGDLYTDIEDLPGYGEWGYLDEAISNGRKLDWWPLADPGTAWYARFAGRPAAWAEALRKKTLRKKPKKTMVSEEASDNTEQGSDFDEPKPLLRKKPKKTMIVSDSSDEEASDNTEQGSDFFEEPKPLLRKKQKKKMVVSDSSDEEASGEAILARLMGPDGLPLVYDDDIGDTSDSHDTSDSEENLNGDGDVADKYFEEFSVVTYNISFGVAKGPTKLFKGASEYKFVASHCPDGNVLRASCRTNEFKSLQNLVSREGELGLLGLQEYLAWTASDAMKDYGTDYADDHPSHVPTSHGEDSRCYGVAHGQAERIWLADGCALDSLLSSDRSLTASFTGVCQLKHFYEATFTAWDTEIFGNSVKDTVLNLSVYADSDARPCHIFVTDKNYVLINAHFPQLGYGQKPVANINNWINRNVADVNKFEVVFMGDTNGHPDETNMRSLERITQSAIDQNSLVTCCYQGRSGSSGDDGYVFVGDIVVWSKGLESTAPPAKIKYNGTAYREDERPSQADPRSDHEPVFTRLRIREDNKES